MWSRIVSRSGFSFAEVLVAVGILGFALSAIIAFFLNSVSLNENSRNTTTALSHAQLVLEEVRNSNFGSVPAYINNGTWNLNATAVTAKGLGAIKNESIVTTQSGTTLLTVTATVTWTEAGSRTRTLVLTTQMGNI